MSEVQESVEAPAPTIEVTLPAPAPVATPAEIRMTSEQFKHRLDETRSAERRKILAELSVEDLAVARKAIEATKSAVPTEQRVVELEQKTAAQEAELTSLRSFMETTTRERVQVEFASLNDAARKAIEEATDDAEERIALAKIVKASIPTPAPVVEQTPAARAATMPPRSAPDAAAAVSTPNRKQEYDRLKQENPVAAAYYLKRFSREIIPGS